MKTFTTLLLCCRLGRGPGIRIRAGGRAKECCVNDISTRDFLDRRQLVSALRSFRRGDFSVRLPEELSGTDGEILSVVVGKEGKIGHRGRVRGATGRWEDKLRSINELIEDMVQPTAEV